MLLLRQYYVKILTIPTWTKAMLKVLEGDRDAFEVELLKTIWLGSPEAANRMIAKLQSLPQPNLRLVTSPLMNGPLSPAPENE